MNTYTVRLELGDDPGTLLRSLRPISRNGGNLLSIFHERGDLTPRGRIPVEVDLEATEPQYEAIIKTLREEGVNVVQAGTERYSQSLTVMISGHIVDTDLSDTLSRIQQTTTATVTDLSVSSPEGTQSQSSAQIHLGVEEGTLSETLSQVREIVAEKDLILIEPLLGV